MRDTWVYSMFLRALLVYSIKISFPGRKAGREGGRKEGLGVN